MSQKIKILGIRIDKVTLKESYEKIETWLKEDKKRYVVTPNPEIVLRAQDDREFLEIINSSDLNTPDGIGILWADSFLCGSRNIYRWFWTLAKSAKSRKERVTGTDLMEKLCRESGVEIFLLGAGKGVAELAATKFPKAKIVGTYSGSSQENEDSISVEKINNTNAKLLFVAFGAPAQEKWIARNLAQLRNIKVAIGVGGAFDFHANTKKRAPKWMQNFGLEWLYRLIQEPKRLKRIYNATIKFPITVYKRRLQD